MFVCTFSQNYLPLCSAAKDRSSRRPEVFFKKSFLQNFQNLQKTSAVESYF